MHYELQSAHEVAATLRFRKSFRTFAIAQSEDGCWTFRRVGFWKKRVMIRPCGAETDVAVFRYNTWSEGGTLEVRDGRRVLADIDHWQTYVEFRAESGDTLIKFEVHGLKRRSAAVEIQPKAVLMPELPLMVFLGWYLIIITQTDLASADTDIPTLLL
jgi:hypothetical protein